MAYDRENKIVYVDPSTDPDLGVEIADIQKVVPVTIKRTVNGVTEAKSSSDLGVLCSAQVGDSVPDNAGGAAWIVSSRIDVNPWAKYKPVPFNLLDTTKHPNRSEPWLNADKTWNSSAQWWRYKALDDNTDLSYRCGFHVPRVPITDLTTDGLSAWTRYRPRGKQTINGVQVFEPFRILDFNQYYHRAVCPFTIVLPEEATKPLYLDGKISAVVQTTNNLGPLNLTLKDIFGLDSGNVYVGIALFKLSSPNNEMWFRTQQGNSPTMTLQSTNDAMLKNYTGKVRLVAFATTEEVPQWTKYDDQVIVYSLNAPGIAFDVMADCTIKPQPTITYDIDFDGISNLDDLNFMKSIRNVGIDAYGYVSGETRYGQSRDDRLSREYTLIAIILKIYEVGSGGSMTLVSATGNYSPTKEYDPSVLDASGDLTREQHVKFILKTKEPTRDLPSLDESKSYCRQYVFKYL